MTEEDWPTTDDWQAMLGPLLEGGLRRINGTRRLRLWAVAVCRHILDRHAREPISPGDYDHWFDALSDPILPRLGAAEDYADGHISRRELHSIHTGSGGPHNVFHTPLWHSRLTVEEVRYAFQEFRDEFGVPTNGEMAALLRDIFGNPFRPVAFDPRWRSESAVALARTAYDTRNFTLLPILADSLEEAGCDHPDVLTHCRDPEQVHVRGCWVVDLVLNKS